MTRVLALVLVLAVVAFARAVGGEGTGRFASMALGFVLIVASLIGEAFDHVGLPRLTGYLLVGLAFGPSALDVITPAMVSQLTLVNGLAVAIIAFGAGIELDLAQLARERRSLVRHGGLLIAILFAGLFAAVLAATPWLPFTADEPVNRRIAIAIVIAAVMATFSPTVVMAVLTETRAKGALSERVLALVVAGDLALVLLFTVSMTVARTLDGGGAHVHTALRHVVWEVLGSIGVGAIFGVGLYAYRRFVDRRHELAVLAVCLLLAEVGSRVGLSVLLSSLAAGIALRALQPDSARRMEELLASARLPILVVFFAAAGASLHLDALVRLAPLVAGLAAVRVLLIWIGNATGARLARLPAQLGALVPFGLVSQAGVTLGLAVLVGRQFPEWGPTLETLFVATIALHEFVGPVAFRWALAKAGELPEEEQRTVHRRRPAPT